MSVEIQIAKENHFEDLLGLFSNYQVFYQKIPNLHKNRAYLQYLLTHPNEAIQFIALDEKRKAVGFATLYFPLSSLIAQRYCLLNDLYTLPETRGLGVGRALVARCYTYAKDHGFTGLEWMTQKNNQQAQRLYDALPTQKSEWIYYGLYET